MIIDRLENAERYFGLNAGFAAAFAFLRNDKLEDLANGRHVIEGERLYASIMREQGRDKSQTRLEAHRKYIDIQVPINRHESMGWKARAACAKHSVPYDSGKDVEFFEGSADSWVVVNPGEFAVFCPEDVHAPLLGSGEIHKVVVKVAV